MRFRLFPLVIVTAAAACAHSSSKPDFGAPSDVYPAPHTALPQLHNYGGPILHDPVVYSVTWPGDSLAPQLDDFVSKIGGSDYWAATTAEYGVAPAVAGTAIHISTAAPAAISGNGIDTMLQSMLDGTHPEWGTPTNQSAYVLFFPAGTVIDGDSCQSYLAYHSSVVVTGGIEVAYAVIPRCGAFGGLSVLDVATDSASHELVEAATDPDAEYAWADTDDSNGAWDWLSGGGENADMCQDVDGVDWSGDPIGYVLQRSWSNQAAAASHDPCQPSSGVYFNAAPVLPDTSQINFGGGFSVGSGSVAIPVGKSRTIELDLFSDAPLSAPFTISAKDAAQLYGYPKELSFSFDRTSGVNGEKVHLTIKVERSGQLYNGGSFFYILATQGGTQQYWPVFVDS